MTTRRVSSRSLSSGPSVRGTRVHGKRVLTLILAGGKGKRLGVLTRDRAKPAVPFGGTYRLIDFALSNCVHSGLSDVWVIEEFALHTLNDHLANGRPWDLDRTYGGLRVLPPYRGPNENEGGFASGNADAIHIHRTLIREYEPDVILVLSADHVYTLDYSVVIQRHLEREASVTIVTTRLPDGEDATRFGNVTVRSDGRVTDFQYKPEKPASDLVTTEVFVYDAPTLLSTLDELAHAKGDDHLGDFGHELIPNLVKRGRAFAFQHDQYWRDVGLPGAYWQAHMDLIDGLSPALDNSDWPVLSSSIPRAPARVEREACIDASLVAYGCRIAGNVRRSVLSPGVVVEAGATVDEAVILRDVVIRAGATVRRAVVDEGVTVDVKATVGGEGEITMIGHDVTVEAGTCVTAGTQVEPRTS